MVPEGRSSAGADSEELHRVPPALGVALVKVPLAQHRPSLLLQEADRHIQDVGLLQLGVWILAVELLLQQRLELVYAAVDTISAHLLHQRFP